MEKQENYLMLSSIMKAIKNSFNTNKKKKEWELESESESD